MDNFITEEFIVGQHIQPGMAFSLKQNVFGERAQVYFNGLRQNSANYEIVGNELTLKVEVEIGHIVVVDYWF